MNNNGCLREFAKYVSLNVLGTLALSCYIFADTLFVSIGVGSDGLTALNLAIPIFNLIIGCGLMIGMGGATKFAIQKSQNDSEKANKTFTNCIYIYIVLSVVFVLIALLFSNQIVSLLGADEKVFDMTHTYLQVLMLFTPAFLLNYILQCFVRNDGAPHLAMAGMITGSLSNVFLDWLFIFPLNMGIFGAVFATGLAPIISLCIISTHFIRRKNSFHLVKCKPEIRKAGSILSTGVPSLISELSSGIVIMIFNFIILNLQGNVGVAAYSVVANLYLIIISIFNGIAQGIQPLISKNYGLGNIKNINLITRYAYTSMFAAAIAIYIVMFIFANPVTSAFNSENDPLLQQMAVTGMNIYFLAAPFAGFNVITTVYFTSSERAKPAQIITMLRGFIVIIPTSFLLAYLGKLTGVWCSFPVSEFIVAIVACILYFAYKKRFENKFNKQA